ncbi:MAG: hypothetical protein CW346_11245 [Bacillaceae bacterium]|nr:hypothetical protein [Bacillaceae bacterium]
MNGGRAPAFHGHRAESTHQGKNDDRISHRIVLCRPQAYNQQGKKSQAKGRQNRYPVPFLPGMSLKPARAGLKREQKKARNPNFCFRSHSLLGGGGMSRQSEFF